MPKLNFIDMRTKKSFSTDKFIVKVMKNGRKAAVATAPSGAKSFRFVPKSFK